MKPTPNIFQQSLAEFLGTFAYVFAGTGTIAAGASRGGEISWPAVAVAFGATAAVMTVALGVVSQAHFNPAVTLARWVAGAVATPRVLAYVFAQLAGAVAASAVLFWCFGRSFPLGATLPLDDQWQRAFVIEVVITFVMMLAVLAGARSPLGPLAVGLAVAAGTVSMGPITGASMNPARSLGPAVVAGAWQHHWLYWVAPILGAQLATGAWRIFQTDSGEGQP